MNHTKYSNRGLKLALETLSQIQPKSAREKYALGLAKDVVRNNIWEPLYENDAWNYPEDGSVVRIETGFDRRAEVAVFMKFYDLDGFTYTNAFVGPSGETVVRYSLDAEWQYAPECEKEIKFLREDKKEIPHFQYTENGKPADSIAENNRRNEIGEWNQRLVRGELFSFEHDER